MRTWPRIEDLPAILALMVAMAALVVAIAAWTGVEGLDKQTTATQTYCERELDRVFRRLEEHRRRLDGRGHKGEQGSGQEGRGAIDAR